MADPNDPADVYHVPEDQRLDVDEGPDSDALDEFGGGDVAGQIQAARIIPGEVVSEENLA